MRRACTLFLTLLALAGCDDDGPAAESPAPETDAAPAADAAALADAAPPADAGPQDAAPPPPPPPLIGPAPAADDDPAPDVVAFDLVASVELVTLADGLRYSGMAYNGQVPGPTIEAKVGDTLEVRFTNDLDEPTTVHWHGLRIPDDMDGNPRIQAPVQPGETFTYRFTLPEAGTFWYHPHVRTNQQLEKGLYGVVVVRDPAEPRPAAERVLALDDILVDERGALYPFLASHPEVMHGRNGNVLLTNGKVEADVGAARQGDVERWRLVNTANARTMTLTLTGASFRVIGTDGGPLVEPYTTDRLQIAVGQRYDLEVRYDRPGQVVLDSHVPVLEGDRVVERAFPVYAVEVEETGVGPVALDWPAATPIERAADGEAELRFNARQGARGLEWTLNGQAHAMEPLFTFTEGETTTLVLVNEAGPEHPFHLHGQFFEIIPDGRPETDQPGLKDTVLVPGLSTVRVKAYLDNPGRWMAHCHILEHAELGMMAEFEVEAAE